MWVGELFCANRTENVLSFLTDMLYPLAIALEVHLFYVLLKVAFGRQYLFARRADPRFDNPRFALFLNLRYIQNLILLILVNIFLLALLLFRWQWIIISRGIDVRFSKAKLTGRYLDFFFLCLTSSKIVLELFHVHYFAVFDFWRCELYLKLIIFPLSYIHFSIFP